MVRIVSYTELPCSSVVKSLSADAGDTDLRSPRAEEQLSLYAATTEPACHKY